MFNIRKLKKPLIDDRFSRESSRCARIVSWLATVGYRPIIAACQFSPFLKKPGAMMRSFSAILLMLVAAKSLAAEGIAVTKTGDHIPYITYGSGSPSLVLIHGWTNNRTFWEPHVAVLSRDYQVVTLDLASFGESLYERDDWSMGAFALDVDTVISNLEIDEVILVGFSMGGSVALELASSDRKYVRGVVLVDMHQDPEWRPDEAFIESFVEYEQEMWGNEEYIATEFSDGASKTLVRRYISRTPETAPEVWWDSIRQLFLWIRDDFYNRVVLIDAPIVAINSAREPTNVAVWKEIAPGFQVHVIEDVGHLGVIWEKTEEFDQALLEYVGQFEQ
jgi:pimeloyl-ACP methyl ester carboxylesterase